MRIASNKAGGLIMKRTIHLKLCGPSAPKVKLKLVQENRLKFREWESVDYRLLFTMIVDND
jgi:hypothetical protein